MQKGMQATNIQKKQTAKYLGLEIDSHWIFKNHIIIKVITKLRQLLPKIYQLKGILNAKTKKILYESWVESIIRYGIELFGFTSNYLIERMQKIQNKIIKVLFAEKEKNTEKKATCKIYKENEKNTTFLICR